MVNEEFNLSKKIVYWRNKGFIPANGIHIEDVKEFIKRLKEKIKLNKEIGLSEKHNLRIEINKLAGDKLNG